MKLSFSTRGWGDLSWDTLLDTALEMKFTGIEVYDLYKFPALTGKGGPFHPHRVAATIRQLRDKKLSIPCLDTSMDLSENEANAEEFRKRHIISREKQIVLNGAGINLESYPYCEYPKNEKFHFLYLGRIMREKGMDELFWAVKKLHQEGEKFVLDLVGFFEDEYKEQVEDLEKQGIAVFHGFSENPRPYYEGADCVVMPSYHEGMSNVLLEAAAVGRPVVTSDIPGCREAVEDKKTGCLVKVKDEDSLYEGMKYVLRMSRAEREAMGMAGRKKMKREFDKRTVVGETVKALGV